MTGEIDWDAIVDPMAEAMRLTIRREWRDAVIANLKATAQHAELVLSLPLPDTIEPAPVFEA
jgi:hypothetical protein